MADITPQSDKSRDTDTSSFFGDKKETIKRIKSAKS